MYTLASVNFSCAMQDHIFNTFTLISGPDGSSASPLRWTGDQETFCESSIALISACNAIFSSLT
jgi:hypothetical protein